MANELAADTSGPLTDRIRRVLLDDWDPNNNAAGNPAGYDGYIPPLRDLILGGASEEQVMAFLKEREAETMCFPSLGSERLRRPARKLLALRDAR